MLDAARPNEAGPGLSRQAGWLLLPAFAATLLASAFLLFAVQPIVSRLVLPRLGGSPAVWNTCVCFFQAVLLLGYGYAHIVSTRLRPAAQVTLHAVLLAAGLATMPLGLGDAAPAPGQDPAVWLITLLATTVGLPFVAIAATAPLLQSWFAGTTHPQARDPYFLYAASNVGSFLALLGYPVLIETTMDLSDQTRFWSVGFAVTAAAVFGCGIAARVRAATATTVPIEAGPGSVVGASEKLRWMALAFVPSALMLAVTTHITTDVAAVPLFWVAPLAIYILTFILAFARGMPLAARPWLLPAQGLLIAGTALLAMTGPSSLPAMIVPLGAFAATAAVCHAELAARRPAANHLTAFFLLISAGGALGGLFNAMVAPVLFRVPLEFPLLLVLACLLRPRPGRLDPPARDALAFWGDLLLPVGLFAACAGLLWADSIGALGAVPSLARISMVALPAALLLLSLGRRLRLALALAACFLVPLWASASNSKLTVRSFFGVYRVQPVAQEDLVVLQHGTTAHGMQSTRPGEAEVPLGYYHRMGPFGRFFAVRDQGRRDPISVGAVGLGIGSLACYARPGDAWTFYEIDPAVEALARDDRWFHFLSQCGNQPAVKIGDARVSLTAETASRYDVLVVDAFSSDSVPVHLLTREALALYFARLKPGGVVLFHVTNRHLALTPVVSRIGTEAGAMVRRLRVPAGADRLRRPITEVVAVAPPGSSLDDLAEDGWDVPQPGPVLWTDERSDILGVIRW